MNYKIFIITIILILMGSTICISILSPKLHKPLVITSDKTDITKTDKETDSLNVNLSTTEILWWNQWKSNLHNKFYRDLALKTNSAIPDNYHFLINFEVTNDSKIINLKVEGNPDSYRKILELYTKQILKSYENTSILKFPQNTKLKNKPVKIEFSNTGKHKGDIRPEDFADDYEVIQSEK